MIKILLAEDEPPVMRMFEKLIEDYSHSFTISARVPNGKRALEALKSNDIDVVFSDIRMPVVDGLELAGEIQKEYPNIYTVLVSGYQDFDYARRAIQYGVFDYLTKPVSKDSLAVVLNKLEIAVNIRKNEEKRKNILKAINDDLPAKDISSNSECVIILICAGAFPLSRDDSLLPSRTFWDKIDLEGLVKEILGSSDSSMVFNGKTSSEKAVLIEMGLSDETKQFIDNLYNRLNDMGNLPITIASPNKSIGINEVSEALRTLRAELYSKICLCRPMLITDDAPDVRREFIDGAELSDSIINAINSVNSELIKERLCNIFQKFDASKITQVEVAGFLKGIVSKAISVSDPFDRALLAINSEIDDSISNTIDFESLAGDISSIFLSIKEKNNLQDKVPSLIRNIELYLNENYNTSITNTVLSNKFGFVPSYISKLFKSYMGISPGEYLTRYRINKAKQLMKANRELMVKEVAALVGIEDQYYFSKLFKKETGQWPTEFTG